MLRQQSLQARHLSELILLSFILVNLEVLERVGILGGGNNTEEILKRVLLQVLLCKVLEVPLGEGDLGGEDDLGTLLLDGDNVAELARLAVNLDAVVEELLKRGEVKNGVVHGDRAVDIELVERLAGGGVLRGGGSFRLFENETI